MQKKMCLGVGVALLAGLVAFAQQPGSAADEVLRAQRAEGDALVKKDKAADMQLLADDYSYIHSNGVVADKAQDLVANMAADIKWTSVSFSDLKPRVYGDTAIVTGVETLEGSAKGYVPGPRRITDVWVKRNGGWQSAGGISTVVSKDRSQTAATSAVKELKAKTINGANADERAVLQADDAYMKTELANDDAKAKTMQTKDFSFVSRAGAVASPSDAPGPNRKALVVAYERIHSYRTLAVIQGLLLWTDVKGFSPGVLRFQRVWVKDGNGWKIAAEQRTPMAAAKPTT